MAAWVILKDGGHIQSNDTLCRPISKSARAQSPRDTSGKANPQAAHDLHAREIQHDGGAYDDALCLACFKGLLAQYQTRSDSESDVDKLSILPNQCNAMCNPAMAFGEPKSHREISHSLTLIPGMSTNAGMPTVLTAIVCVARTSAPAMLALDHVLQLLDEFVDVPMLASLPKAATSGSVRWFDRVYQRTIIGSSTLATPPRIEEDPLVEYTLAKAMQAAVKNGHRAITQRIHELHPQRLPVRLLRIAAEAGDLAMFQWMLAHRNDDLCTPGYDSDARVAVQPAPIELVLSCCLQYAYRIAIRHEQLHIVKWLLENGYTPPNWLHGAAGNAASSTGDLEMVQWLHTNNIPNSFSKHAIGNAAKHGHSQVVQYLVTNRTEGFSNEAVHNAVIGRYDDIHEVLRLSGMLPVAEFESLGKWANDAAKAGRLDLLESSRYAMDDANQAMRSAAHSGHLQVVQWFWQHHEVRPDPSQAAHSGHLHILRWIHHEIQPATYWDTTVMNSAAQNGHLAVLQWLHANRPEGWTTAVMDYASANGHLEVVQWLHENRQEGCTANAIDFAARKADAMDLAAQCNHREIVEWLHIHHTEGCTTQAMTEAARNGHLEMVIWLHEHRQEGYSPDELYDAPLHVLKWFHFNRHEGFTTNVMDNAAICGVMATLEFLHQHRTEGCSTRAAADAASQGHLPIVQWLHEKYPHQFDGERVVSHARDMDHFHIVRWLEDQQLAPINE